MNTHRLLEGTYGWAPSADHPRENANITVQSLTRRARRVFYVRTGRRWEVQWPETPGPLSPAGAAALPAQDSPLRPLCEAEESGGGRTLAAGTQRQRALPGR